MIADFACSYYFRRPTDGNITGIGFGIIAKLTGIGSGSESKSLPESDSESLKVDSPQVWAVIASPACPCGESHQTTCHIVEECP